MVKLSFLVSVFSGRDIQFDMSLASLTKLPYDHRQVELLVFVDYSQNDSTQLVIKKYRQYFSKIRVFSVTKKFSAVNHSASRRNFLAKEASGDFIIFEEPEMLHVNNTVEYFLQRINSKDATKQWICGPVYAAQDLVDKKGKIIDDSCQLANLEELWDVLKTPHFTKDSFFRKNYRLIDYSYYKTPFFCAMFNRKHFLKLRGLNQNLKVRGFEELEFHERFSKAGGEIICDDNIATVHIPHNRSLDRENQIAWNLYNSTVEFDPKQVVGKIDDALFEEIEII